MLPQNTIIWFNGEYKYLKDSSVSLLTHGLHYGTSVFEGIRAYSTENGTAIFCLEEHIERLLYSAESLYINLEFSREEIMEACREVLRKNNLESAYIRPLIFFGDENMGLNPLNCTPQIAIIAWEWGKYLGDEVQVKISSIKRISEHTSTVDAKIGGHYINSIYATLEAKQLGFDEALLLDHDNNIAEGPGENIFFIKSNTLYTPKLGKILKGITREKIISVAKELDYQVVERNISPHEIDAFDSAFFTGTAAEITPISQISGIKYDTSKVKDIEKKFFEIVEGREKKFDKWLSYLY